MSLIPVVGRKSLKMRLVIALLYLVLTAGAATTVYPFLVMLGESITSPYDQAQFAIIPRYLYDKSALFGKFAEDKYSGDLPTINAEYRTAFMKIEHIDPPRGSQAAPADRVADWNQFFLSVPPQFKHPAFEGTPAVAYTPNLLGDRYQAWLQQKFHGDIQALDRAYVEEDLDFSTVLPPFEEPTKHNWLPDSTEKASDWREFQESLPAYFFKPISGDASYESYLKEVAYGDKLASLNAAWGTSYTAFTRIPLGPKPEGNVAERKDWETCVRTQLPIRFVVVDPSAVTAYRQFLRQRYHSIDRYDNAHQDTATRFDQVPLPTPDTLKPSGSVLVDYVDFLRTAAPLSSLTVDSLETRYRAFAQTRYHMSTEQTESIAPPIYSADYDYAVAHTSSLRWQYATQNYALVLRFMRVHGNSIPTTIVYCTLAVLTALIVNPLCAYALSRFRLPYAAAVLLFLLATMAFPGEVTQIPVFLMLKQFGMLNSFAALILPGLANGYSIFLLKGFFDSLPQELYEAGTLDGAGELLMFWKLTIPLSTPIFAVIGLGAFTSAYSSFLFAMLYCPDPKMWTIMVWVYELQSAGTPEYIMLAALTIVSIPTLLVFVFAQNTIMKGIILPSYK